MEQPKILIVSRLVWDDDSVSNTLTNLFGDYNPNKIARIYIETKQPNTKCCYNFYQISEISLVKKLFHWNLKTGKIIKTMGLKKSNIENDVTANQEASTMKYVRGHRTWFFSLLRDFIWGLNGWKTKELKQFILDFNPDVVWLDGSPLILMNRLNNYVYKIAKKPTVTFLMDDVYNYESCTGTWDKIYKFFLRKYVKDTVDNCQHVFVASPKMKKEYDKEFHIKSTFISKSFDTEIIQACNATIHRPIKLVYLGNVLIGRLDSLVYIGQCLKEINKDRHKIQLSIYTNDYISEESRKILLVDNSVKLCPSVPYNKVSEIIHNSDVQVFVESLDGKNMSVARLSFSTKIIDYISSGKCILALGPQKIAPIEYLKNEDAAIVATSKKELMDSLLKLINPEVIHEYAEKAVICCKRNHDRRMMNERIYSVLEKVAFGD